VFENRVLKRIFGPKRDEVMEEWRKFHNKELHDLNSSPSIIRIIKSRRMRRRWVDNIKRDLGKVVRWGDMDIGLAKDRNRWRALVNSVLNLRVP
jgi:hypothetical protein